MATAEKDIVSEKEVDEAAFEVIIARVLPGGKENLLKLMKPYGIVTLSGAISHICSADKLIIEHYNLDI